ncbi:hypothetical protein NLX83_10195 [Allokutzneria sp. A3M-2-11 16]|uniref:hypothetical protein n=1 Tax=Allokutzneria sp. A3M-2-11 16 TaxID=2962043 RepID=UPI0020B7DDFA|nr:hypothetical protein [Allokutzneria sp. A3M-2-11 16]MCP3799626.1 hypothetical protein [Allokutzneria sp. A3M-2-11 16]
MTPPPPTTGPAFELRYLDLALRAARRQLRNLWVSAAVMWVLSALALAFAARPLATVAIIVVTAMFTGFAVAQQVLVGRWLHAAARMFAAEPWRPVTVRALRGRWLELELESEDVVHVRLAVGMGSFLQALGRAERLWIVGPDKNGWVALHLAGMRAPFPGRIGQQPDAPRTAISAYDPTAPASTDAVTSVAAVALVRLSHQLYLPAKIALSIALGVLIPVAWTGELVLVPISAVAVLIAGGLFVRARKRLAGWPKLTQLLEAGPWQRATAELDEPWEPGPRGAADATATLTLANGEQLPVRLPLLGVDVAEYMRNTGTVWIAGEPGSTFAVGVPGSPILAVADQLQSGPRRAQLQA